MCGSITLPAPSRSRTQRALAALSLTFRWLLAAATLGSFPIDAIRTRRQGRPGWVSLSVGRTFGRFYGSIFGGAVTNCFLWLPGVSGSYASAPDSAALSITGDIDIRVLWIPDTTRPAVINNLAAKWTPTGNQRAYVFYLATDGTLHWQMSTLGVASTSDVASSAAVPSVVGGPPVLWRITSRQSDGRIQFFTGTAWGSGSQLGTDVAGSLLPIFDSTALFEIGSQTGGTIQLAGGKFLRVQVRSNIADDGTGIVFDEDFTTETEGAATVTEDSSNAATVTINGFAKVTPLWAAAPVGSPLADNVDRTDYTFPSTTPKPNRLYLVFGIGMAGGVDPTLTGWTVTWTEVARFNAAGGNITVFAGLSGAAPTTGTLVLSYGAETQTYGGMHVIEVDGADLSGTAAAAVVQVKTGSETNTSVTVTLDNVPAAGSRCFSCFNHNGTNEATTPRTNWVEFADAGHASPSRRIESQWRPNASEQTASASWATSSLNSGVVLEIRCKRQSLVTQPPRARRALMRSAA